MASAFHYYHSAAWRLATKISVYWLASWREVQRIQIWHNDGTVVGWREIYKKSGTAPPPPPPPSPSPPPPPPPVNLTVSLNASSPITGSRTGAGDCIIPFTVTATASGGAGPYTYHWGLVTWSAGTPPYPTSSDAAGSQFVQPSMAANDDETATFKVTAVDSLGNTGSTNIDAEWTSSTYYDGGGGLGRIGEETSR